MMTGWQNLNSVANIRQNKLLFGIILTAFLAAIAFRDHVSIKELHNKKTDISGAFNTTVRVDKEYLKIKNSLKLILLNDKSSSSVDDLKTQLQEIVAETTQELKVEHQAKAPPKTQLIP